MKTVLKIFAVLLLVALLGVPQAAQAADPLALVTTVTLSGNSVIITGTVPCAKWQAYAVTSISKKRVDVTVYRRAKESKLNPKSCAAVVKPYVISATPVLVEGVTYAVYVNGRYRFNMP